MQILQPKPQKTTYATWLTLQHLHVNSKTCFGFLGFRLPYLNVGATIHIGFLSQSCNNHMGAIKCPLGFWTMHAIPFNLLSFCIYATLSLLHKNTQRRIHTSNQKYSKIRRFNLIFFSPCFSFIFLI